ncbi:mechanosensitive ion channel family protein [Methanosarcina sp. Z-7115]|uniref:Mechanosensitive ion channel family protein n=1 Tax=Methanosarcina baikalica TaxID=3073890 RepID=A0ABU2D4K0_9EURY|nr:mechanosensitive ion channel family protein [Methanosarcina sp. Z-7115]MDR7666916.1 mechanosensitive ion channel family protein [Methanosarcina sp. Z-7115]
MRVMRRLNTFILLILILFIAYIRYLTDFYILEDRSLLDALLISLIVVFLAYIINSITRNFILRRISTARDRYTLRKTASILITVLALASLFAIWIERTSTLFIAYGILSAGVAIALQDVLRNIAGGILLVVARPFKAGDRIQVGDTTGDVLDIGSFNTTIMEIREWVDADQYTGRILSVPNSFALNQTIKNYTRDYSFIWDEIRILLIYGSNWKKAKEIALRAAGPVVGEFEDLARRELLRMGKRYFFTTYDVRTNLYMKMEENWIEIRLRYVVEPRKRRAISHLLVSNILEALEKEEDIMVGTAVSVDLINTLEKGP